MELEKTTCTSSKVTLLFEGKEYTFEYDWKGPYPVTSADYMFEEGNYSCDCNKRIFLRRHCGVPCGTTGRQCFVIYFDIGN